MKRATDYRCTPQVDIVLERAEIPEGLQILLDHLRAEAGVGEDTPYPEHSTLCHNLARKTKDAAIKGVQEHLGKLGMTPDIRVHFKG